MSSLRSDNMQGLLQLFFCFALLAKGSCLQCEVCHSNTTSCKGAKQNCSEESTCITSVAQSIMGATSEFRYEKNCGNPSECNWPLLHFDLGKGSKYYMSHHCCKEDDCPEISPTVPSLEKNPNGKRCSACYSTGESCKPDTVECSGKNTECFIVIMNVTKDKKLTKHILQGCGSRNVCDLWALLETKNNKTTVRNQCMISGVPQILASFLTTFSSLWILKLLV